MYIQIQTFFFVLFLFIYCKRAGWKQFPLMAKWEQRGFKCEGGGTTNRSWWREVTQAREEWDRTGAQNEQVACKQRGVGWVGAEAMRGRQALALETHRSWNDDRL